MSNKASFLKSIVDDLITARERSVRLRIRQQLGGLSDRQLADMGFSRELLEQGSEAWPWRAPVKPHGAPMLAAAMKGLNADSEIQPADHNHGRPGNAQADQFRTDDKLAA